MIGHVVGVPFEEFLPSRAGLAPLSSWPGQPSPDASADRRRTGPIDSDPLIGPTRPAELIRSRRGEASRRFARVSRCQIRSGCPLAAALTIVSRSGLLVGCERPRHETERRTRRPRKRSSAGPHCPSAMAGHAGRCPRLRNSWLVGRRFGPSDREVEEHEDVRILEHGHSARHGRRPHRAASTRKRRALRHALVAIWYNQVRIEPMRSSYRSRARQPLISVFWTRSSASCTEPDPVAVHQQLSSERLQRSCEVMIRAVGEHARILPPRRHPTPPTPG